MTIKININEDILAPLIKEHLASGRSVQSLVLDSINFRSKAKAKLQAKGKGFNIYVGKEYGSYLREYELLIDAHMSEVIEDQKEVEMEESDIPF